MMKRFGFLVGSIFLGFQSYKLVAMFNSMPDLGWGLALFFAILINLFVTGTFALLVFGFNIQNILPDSYYTIKSPKALKRLYKILRVDLFKKFLLATVWKKKTDQKKYFDGTKKGLETLVTNSKKSEFGHLFPFIILSGISIYLIVLSQIGFAIFVMLINIVFNFYPIPLQRHHRMRIQSLSRRISK